MNSDPLLPAAFYDPAINDPYNEHDLTKRGVLCVQCSHKGNVEVQRHVYHPAYRGCVLAPERNERN